MTSASAMTGYKTKLMAPAIAPINFRLKVVARCSPGFHFLTCSWEVGVTAKFIRTKPPGSKRTKRDWLLRSRNFSLGARV